MRMPPSCVPPPTHTLSFFPSVVFSFMSARSVHTGNCDIFVSSTHSGGTAMSQCARPGPSSDAAFALKQFLCRNSRTKKDAFWLIFRVWVTKNEFLGFCKVFYPISQHQECKVIQTLVLQVSRQSSNHVSQS